MAYNDPAFRLPFGIYIVSPQPLDLRYGPYLGVGTGSGECFHVDSPIATEGNRVKGLTIGILNNGSVVEYWFKTGVTNGELIIKGLSGGGSGLVESVNGHTGVVILVKADLNLANVDNTSDLNKPVSTATQAAIDAAVLNTIILQGAWNANSNTPDISGATTTGFAWRVSVAGSTDLDGITTWDVGDLAVKTATGWMRIPASQIDAVWGNIGGTLSDQTDLQNALNAKENALGNPTVDDYVLASKADGTRIWIPISNDGTYVTEVPVTTETPEDHGGIPAGTAAGDLTGKSISKILDMILFPSVLAWISTYTNINVNISPGPTTVEVGSNIAFTITSNFNKGVITDGNGSINANPLVGDAIGFVLVIDDVDDISNANGVFAKTLDMNFGQNNIKSRVSFDEGNGSYYNNMGVEGTNLDYARGASAMTSPAKIVNGRYKMFSDLDNIPTNSAEVRGSSNNAFLDGNNKGIFLLTFDADALTMSIALIAGSTFKMTMLSSNADVTGSFVQNGVDTFDVEDAGGNLVSYDIWYQTLGTVYGTDEDYELEIL